MFSDGFGDISNIEEMFSNFSDCSGDSSGTSFGNAMNEEDLKEHLNGLMGGQIGSLAKEIAEEATKELGLDESQEPEEQAKFLQNLKSSFNQNSPIGLAIKFLNRFIKLFRCALIAWWWPW